VINILNWLLRSVQHRLDRLCAVKMDVILTSCHTFHIIRPILIIQHIFLELDPRLQLRFQQVKFVQESSIKLSMSVEYDRCKSGLARPFEHRREVLMNRQSSKALGYPRDG
jgi:hypothetical protein